MIQIVMPEPHGAGRRPQRSFHQAGVKIVVADHHVALLGKRRESGIVGLKAGTENERRFFVNEFG